MRRFKWNHLIVVLQVLCIMLFLFFQGNIYAEQKKADNDGRYFKIDAEKKEADTIKKIKEEWENDKQKKVYPEKKRGYQKKKEKLDKYHEHLQKKHIIDLEVGGGHMLNGSYGYQLWRFELGFGFAYTFGTMEIYGKELNVTLYNISGNISINLLQSDFVWINIRERIAGENIIVGEFSKYGYLFSTDLLIGHQFIFGIISLPYFKGETGTSAFVRTGLGIRGRF